MITAEQFAEWKEHPVTKEIFKELTDVREVLKNRMANGMTLGSTAEETHGLTHQVIGQVKGINQILEISYEDTDE